MLAVMFTISSVYAHRVEPATPAAPASFDSEDSLGSPPAAGVRASDSPDQDPSGGVLLALLILGGSLVRRRPLALALVLIALLFTFESGVHSVHHLGSPSEATHCVVALAATHCLGVVGGMGLSADAALSGPGVIVRGRAETLSSEPHRAFRSRAPPTSPLAND